MEAMQGAAQHAANTTNTSKMSTCTDWLAQVSALSCTSLVSPLVLVQL